MTFSQSNNVTKDESCIFEVNIHVKPEKKASFLLLLEILEISDFIEGAVDCYIDFDYENTTADLYAPLGDQQPIQIYRDQKEAVTTLVHTITTALAQDTHSLGLGAADATIAVKTLGAKDWQESWKESFRTITIGEGNDTLFVVPPWEQKTNATGAQIVIDPGMAFGTGQHETTQLCLKIFWDLTKAPQNTLCTRTLDVGTGSGILAMAAALRGAKEILGIDIDPQCTHIATQNALLNNITNTVFSNDSLNYLAAIPHAVPYDLVFANIQIGPITKLFADLLRVVKQNGYLIFSGILSSEKEEMQTLLAKHDLEHAVRGYHEQGDWSGWLIQKNTAKK